jgi:hypothetical protein
VRREVLFFGLLHSGYRLKVDVSKGHLSVHDRSVGDKIKLRSCLRSLSSENMKKTLVRISFEELRRFRYTAANIAAYIAVYKAAYNAVHKAAYTADHTAR